jgi:hypothetical protein
MRSAVDSAQRLQSVQPPEKQARAEPRDETRDRDRAYHRAIAELQEYLASFGIKKPQRPERTDPVHRMWPDMHAPMEQQPQRAERPATATSQFRQDLASLKQFLASVNAPAKANAAR